VRVPSVTETQPQLDWLPRADHGAIMLITRLDTVLKRVVLIAGI